MPEKWSASALWEQGPTQSLDLANEALSIGRSTGYALAKRDEYPLRVLRVGASYRVITTELIELLGLV